MVNWAELSICDVKTRLKKFWRWVVLSIATAYFLSFGILAHYGGYIMVPSGRTITPAGYAINDTMLWQPRFGTYIRGRIHEDDLLGCFYSPLIRLHQHFIRPTIFLTEPDSKGRQSRLPSRAELHPQMHQSLDQIEATLHMTYEEMRGETPAKTPTR